MSSDFIFRLIGMVGLAIGGLFWGKSVGEAANALPGANTMSVEQYTFSFGLVGALVGLLLTPYISTKPVRGLRKLLQPFFCAKPRCRTDRSDRRIDRGGVVVLPPLPFAGPHGQHPAFCGSCVIRLPGCLDIRHAFVRYLLHFPGFAERSISFQGWCFRSQLGG